MRGDFKKLKMQVWERDNFTCAYCGLEMRELYLSWKKGKISRRNARLTVDHIIPRQAPHTHKITTLQNLNTACWECNNKKGGRNTK